MKRKLAVMMLAASVVLSNVTPAMTMTVHAEEAQDDGSGDNEAAPQDEGSSEDAGSNDSAPADEGGSNDSGSSDSGSSSGNDNSSSDSGSNDSGSSSSNDDRGEIGGILDEVFGGNHWNGQTGGGAQGGQNKDWDWDNCNKPTNPTPPSDNNNTTTVPESKPGNTENSGSQNTGSSNTGNTGNSGSSNTGNTQTGNTGSSNTDNTGNTTSGSSTTTTTTTTVTDPVTNTTTTTVTDPATGETVTEVTPGTTAVLPNAVAAPVTDPAVLAVLPEAMVVATTEGSAYIHSLEATRTMYIGWKDGLPECWFQLLKADGTQAAMLDVTPVTDPATGRLYVNVTIDPADGAVEVFGPIEGMVSFTRHMGLDGVMVGGVLIKDFTAVEASVQ